MSHNQSRANRSESHFRKPSRPANSANQRGSSGRGGKGAAATGLPPSPSSSSNSHSSSFSSNRSFKKSNGQGTQSWVIAASANSDSNAPVARAVQNAAPPKSPSLGSSDAPASDCTIRPSESSSQRSNRAVPKAPSSQSRSGTSDSTAQTTTTQGDASKAFSLQFGSFVNRVQVPPRTSSAPPNLVEQKHDQALHDPLRSVPVIPISSIPREQQLRKDVQQSNGRESQPRPQAKGDLHTQVPAAPAITNTQSSSTLPPPGVSMAIPLQKQQVPSQLSVPSPHIQSQGLTTTSLQMPMSLPLGTSTQVQQQVFVPGIQGHPLQHQRMVHQGHGLNFSPHVSHQLGTQLGNLGIGFNPQFSQQQTPRITVKITHPDTHEELRLDKRTDTNLDGGSLGPRSHPLSLQSQPIAYAATHQINYFPMQPNPMFFQSPTSLPLTSMEMPPQASRINYPAGQVSQTVPFMNSSTLNPLSGSMPGQLMPWISDSSNCEHGPGAQAVASAALSASRQVTVKPVIAPIGEKVGSSVVSPSPPVNDKSEMPKLSRSPGEAGSIHSQGDSKICLESYVQQSKSIPEPTVSISQSVTTNHSVAPSAAVSVEKLPLSASNFPFLTGETASIMNDTGRRRESVRRSNSIKDQPKTPSKKDQRHSQPPLQAETSNSAGSSRDAPSYPDNMQAPPLKLVETTASILTWPSPGLEHGRSLEGGVSETVECKATPAPLDSCEDECAGESLPDVHVAVADAPVEGTNSARVGGDSTCGTSNKSSVETVSENHGDVHNVKQYDCTLQEIQPKEGILGSAEQGNSELSEQPQLDSSYIRSNGIEMLADSSSESFKVGNYSEQDFNSSETTVHSEIVTMEIEQNELKNEVRDCILEVDKPGCKAVTSTDPSSDLNDSQISPYSSVLSTDCCEIRSPTLEASKRGSLCLDSQEIPLLESGKTHQESSHTPAPVVSAAVSKLGEKVSENANAGLVQITISGSKDKPILEVNRGKSTTAKGKKKRREVLQKADAAGTTSDLYMAYKGPNEKPEPAISSESVDSMSGIDARQVSLDFKEKDVRASKEDGQSEAEPDDWEDAADIASPKLKISDNAEQVHVGLQRHEEDVDGVTGRRKYSRDFLLTFSGQCTDLPADCEIRHDLMEAPRGSKVSISKNFDRNPNLSFGRIIDRPIGVARPDQRVSGMVGVDRWNKSPGPFSPGQDSRVDIGQGGNFAGFRPTQGGNHGFLRNMHGLVTGQYGGGILSGPLFPLAPQGGMQRNGSDADRWQRGLIPSPQSPLQVMHKATNKYEIRQVTDEEEAKQRQLKAILNKLTPQNFEKLFDKVKEVNIDNADTLSGVISQIFDKALMEPTFCEMYANFCYYLADVLPDFTKDNEKITFKRLLLNKCQEEFERGEREQAEANRVEEDGEVKQSEEGREEKKIQARRRMLGNIRLIGELYKKKMLTERIMHECIVKLLGQYQNPDEEDIEALCKLMSTIGEMIDHPKAKAKMDKYFDTMANLSNNMALSSRLRFMLKDAIDLRKNKWQQRRKVEGPKKIEEVHRDAAQERQAQAGRLARGSSNSFSARRVSTPDFSPRGSTVFSSPNTQTGAFRGFPSQVCGFGTQDVRSEDRHTSENRMLAVPLQHRPIDNDSLTLGPQGGLARGLSVRGQPMLSSAPQADLSMGPGISRRMASGPNGFSSVSDSTSYNSREEPNPRYVQERFVGQPAFDQSKFQEHRMYGSRETRNANHSSDRFMAGSSTRVQATSIVSSETVWPEDRLKDMSIAAIREFYSAKNENEVALCIKDMNSPSFHSSMISTWVTDSFERNDRDRNLLAGLLITLTKARDGLLSPVQLIEGFESVLATLEDAVTDAPKAAEFLGHILGKVIVENAISLREIGKLIHEGGEEPGHLLQIGLGYEVIDSTLEMIRSEKGESFLSDMCTSSNLQLEDFRPPDPTK